MFIHKLDIATIRLEKLTRRYELPEVLVEFEFLTRRRINEGIDEFEEGPNDPGD